MDTRRQVQLDPRRYARAQQHLDAERGKLTPEAVERLAREAVARLAAIRVARPVDATGPHGPDVVHAFCDVLIHKDAQAALAFVQSRFPENTAAQTDIYDLIAASARQLGDMWDGDQVTFLQVTTSVAKLYALVRSIGRSRRLLADGKDIGNSALFASVPGEQHTLGVTIAAELFRDAGWEIDLQIGRSQDELVQHSLSTRPPVIGLSLHNSKGLPALSRLTETLRLSLPSVIIAVAGGADTDAQTLMSAGSFDMIIQNAKQAQADLSDMLLRRRLG